MRVLPRWIALHAVLKRSVLRRVRGATRVGGRSRRARRRARAFAVGGALGRDAGERVGVHSAALRVATRGRAMRGGVRERWVRDRGGDARGTSDGAA